MTRRTIPSKVLLVGVTCVVALMTTTQVAAQTSTRIMSGLNNPRGLALGPDGGIYVAEAGTGGAGPCQIGSTNQSRCYGLTGAISRFLNGAQQRVVSELPSHAPAGSTDEALGPQDVGFMGTTMYVTMGLGFDPSTPARPQYGFRGSMFGTVLQIARTGEITEAGDVAGYERDVNSAGGPLDSNPYGLLVLPTLRIVADAGANALLSIVPSGLVNTMAVFPSRPQRTTDAVPTSVAVGPDGAYYVGELSGVPFAAGAANVYRVVPGQAPPGVPKRIHDGHRHRLRARRQPLRGGALDRPHILRVARRYREDHSHRTAHGPGIQPESPNVGARHERRHRLLHQQGHHSRIGRSVEADTLMG
jgi:hypothetical protein